MTAFGKKTDLQPAANSCGLLVECWTAILDSLVDESCWDLSFVRDICHAGEPVCCWEQIEWLEQHLHSYRSIQGIQVPTPCAAVPRGPSVCCFDAGMASKTLALAAQQTFRHLEAHLGHPCPSPCRDSNSQGLCLGSWGHAELPESLVSDPCSLKVSQSAEVRPDATLHVPDAVACRRKSWKLRVERSQYHVAVSMA